MYAESAEKGMLLQKLEDLYFWCDGVEMTQQNLLA